jgi:hypothetical protein
MAGRGEAGLYYVGLVDLFNCTAVFWGPDMQRMPT